MFLVLNSRCGVVHCAAVGLTTLLLFIVLFIVFSCLFRYAMPPSFVVAVPASLRVLGVKCWLVHCICLPSIVSRLLLFIYLFFIIRRRHSFLSFFLFYLFYIDSLCFVFFFFFFFFFFLSPLLPGMCVCIACVNQISLTTLRLHSRTGWQLCNLFCSSYSHYFLFILYYLSSYCLSVSLYQFYFYLFIYWICVLYVSVLSFNISLF